MIVVYPRARYFDTGIRLITSGRRDSPKLAAIRAQWRRMRELKAGLITQAADARINRQHAPLRLAANA